MTPDVKLLPLPESDGRNDIYGEVHDYYYADTLRTYARANMEPLIAENERLRTEAAKRDGIDPWAVLLRAQEAEARAERLAEALREVVAVFSESGMYDTEVFDSARAALDQEGGNG